MVSGGNRRYFRIVLIYAASVVVFWYRLLGHIHHNFSPSQEILIATASSSLRLRDNRRIILSLQRSTGSVADAEYYTKFSEPAPYMCKDEQGKNRLPSTLQKYFNFIASIETDLKIISIGDSITAQFAQALDAAAVNENSARAKHVMSSTSPDVVCMSIASPIKGGGVTAFWRVTNILLNENNRWPAHCSWVTKQHWHEGQALAFLNHEYQSPELAMPQDDEYNQNSRTMTEFWQRTKLTSFKTDNVNVVNSFDVVILRLPHGWLELDYMNNATRIRESVETAHRVLGATTIVIPTLPLYNNVMNEDDWKSVAQINRLIREVARNITVSNGDIQYVLVQEFGNMTNQLLTENAKNLGLISPQKAIDYSHEDWEVGFAKEFLKRPMKTKRMKWPPSHSQVCLSLSSNEAEKCPGVKISPDGMHWCVETLGGRFTANIACLLGCVYNVVMPPSHEGVRKCEQRCNDQFMSLVMVEEEMFKS